MKAYLGIGSNLGDRLGNIRTALSSLSSVDGFRVVEISPVYETPPLYRTDQEKFLNCVIEVETDFTPHKLLQLLKTHEVRSGRVQAQPRYSPRPLDLDILAYENLEIHHNMLQIPHPKLSERKFVLQPWADIAPDFEVPGSGRTVRELLLNCGDTSEITIVNTNHYLLIA